MRLQDYLKKKKLITDGSFGTYFSAQYHSNEIPEKFNRTDPEKITAIHLQYLQAGSLMLRTNTFASNSFLLDGGWEEVKANLTAGVANARAAIVQAGMQEAVWTEEAVRAEEAVNEAEGPGSGQEIYIAGDIGPIPTAGFAGITGIQEEYFHIASTFLEQGVHVLVFETFPDFENILPAIRRIRRECGEAGETAFILVQFAINQFGYSSTGFSARKLLTDAGKEAGINAIGLNCGVGPAHMCQLLTKIHLPEEKFLSTLPNAGYPRLDRSELSFHDSSHYFALKMADLADLGSDILGGCCGTNPSYIKEICLAIDRTQRGRKTAAGGSKQRTTAVNRSFLYEQDGTRKKHKLIAVELAPPLDADDEKVMESAHLLQQAKVDVLTFPDSPSGRTRIDSVLMAAKVHRQTGMCVMPHICCRDKNAIAMRSTLMGADINDIHNLLIITGDPLPSMVRQTVKTVFNFDSVGLMNIIKEMNEDTFHNTVMSYGGAINQGRKPEPEIARVKKKMEAGAEFFLTQPMFCAEDVARIRRIKEETGAVILCGIMPLISRRNALFMKNEISGVNVTEEVLTRYPENATRAEGEAAGIALAKEMIAMSEDFADGYYFSFPFNRISMLEKILK